MSEYHVRCGIFGIYAGTLKSNGCEWRNKPEVTKEALDSVEQYLFQNNKELRFSKDGKKYSMCIVEKRDDEQDETD